MKSECTDQAQAAAIPEDKIPLSGCRCPFCQKTCLESLIRARVFESENLEVFKQKTDRERLHTFAQNEWNFKLLKQYIGFMVGTIINLFNPEVLILTGRLYDCVPEIWNSMNILKSGNSLSYSGSRCTIIPGSKRDNSVAVGAASVRITTSIPTGRRKSTGQSIKRQRTAGKAKFDAAHLPVISKTEEEATC